MTDSWDVSRAREESQEWFRNFADVLQDLADVSTQHAMRLRELRETVAVWQIPAEHREQHVRLQSLMARAEEAYVNANRATSALAAMYSQIADNEI